MTESFDYIVVGGGSSGCVMASRLSEDPSSRVLLIESGQKDGHPWIHIPSTFFKVIEKGRDIVAYVGEPTPELNDRPSIVIQGHVIGGGSSVNAMLYVRGHANDYNQWAQLGNRGWAYDDVLPVFRDLENNTVFSDEFHGRKGELHVSKTRYQHPLCKAFVQAGQQVDLRLDCRSTLISMGLNSKAWVFTRPPRMTANAGPPLRRFCVRRKSAAIW